MKKPYIFKRLILSISLSLIFCVSFSQILITTLDNTTPEQMVAKIAGEGVIVSNVVYDGVNWASGIFSNGGTTNLGIDEGIFLTTGSGELIPGPNSSSSSGMSNGLTGGGGPWWPPVVYDPSVLTFDITPVADTLRFKYVFFSEEYSEWVGSTFNDQMELRISGPDPLGGTMDKNMAIVPGTINTNVSINNVNNGYAAPGMIPVGPCTHCEYFNDNTGGLTLQCDGKTVVMTAWTLVVPGETYQMVFWVVDIGDHIYDTGFFIESNSLKSPGGMMTTEVYPDPPGITDNLIEGHVNANVVFRLPVPADAPLTIDLEIGGTANNIADFVEPIADQIFFNVGEDSVVVSIQPVEDGIIEGFETVEIIYPVSQFVPEWKDTLVLVIEDYVQLSNNISPSTAICEGNEVTLTVEVMNGYPPYSYLWEPGGYTTDSITVSPESTTTYVVSYSDLFGETAQDSVQITVLPFCELESFNFETVYNPGLPFEVIGEVTNDTVYVVFPLGTDLSSLTPSFTFVNETCTDTVGEIIDLTNPVVYEFLAPGGCSSEWLVIADIETGIDQVEKSNIQIFPNPATDELMIDNASGWEATLYNMLGLPISNKKLITNNFVLNLNTFDGGIYLLKLKKQNQALIQRIIITK